MVKVFSEKQDLIPASYFEHAKYPFEFFNPVQSRAIDFIDNRDNLLVASSTASGKTITSEIFLAEEIRKNKKKGLYLAPLRSLAQEKFDDWRDKDWHFHDIKICICTGDYRLTPARKLEVDESDLIIMTSEMLNSRSRNFHSENNQFLQEIGTCVIDECFPPTTPVRIDYHLELPIKKIYEDERISHVLAYDHSSGQYVQRRILRKIKKERVIGLVSIRHQEGNLVCTENHKIWTKRGYVKAIDLTPEDEIKFIPSPSYLECPICNRKFSKKRAAISHYTYAHVIKGANANHIDKNHTSKVISVKRWGRKIDYVYDLEVEELHNYFANGVLVSNCHIISSIGRGDHLESGIMKFVEVNPDVRFVLLSATLPNVEQIAEWIEKITNRSCNVIRSNYRPCPLNINFPIYRSNANYDENEEQKISRAMDLIEKYSGDKFLAFVHSKRTGDQLLKRLAIRKIVSGFHNADLPKEKRLVLEDRFKNDPNFRVLVATSTLAWGANLPSRRVVILGVHRGKTEVENYDIIQECGRAGRPKYDPVGDAYVLVPDLQALKHKERILTPTPIESRLIGANVLAFHLISEIHHRHIQNLSDVDRWYKKTLAFHQRGFAGIVDCHDALQRLEVAKCIKIDGESLEATGIGAVSSMFYYNPFDASHLCRNFRKLFDSGKEHESKCVAFALSCLPTFRSDNATVAEMDSLMQFISEADNAKARAMYSKDTVINGEVRAAYCYHSLMNDSVKYGTSLGTLANTLKIDFDRVGEMLIVMDDLAAKWNKQELFADLKAKIVHGVEAKYVNLVKLTGIGKVKAQKLYAAGLHTLKQVSVNPTLVASVLHCKSDVATKICSEATNLVFQGVLL